MMAIKTVKT